MMSEPDDDALRQIVAGAIPASPVAVAPMTPTPAALPPLPPGMTLCEVCGSQCQYKQKQLLA